ncbi:MAG: UDP-N-acetylmuramoyl-tripeptide--D-alanyl-D-alanine ligase [Xanthomonadales bacterium]|jgi:UDP-N-acetylmuramoyl-tripeptide--D-alanyl-D-alanine ligase|nr:UDP-N-acetylmuramoyl-tripeptide--D-alanyl-D-alanine ligase [Xanthomonadales bacterium]MBP6078717.1 UDP-N-acetylmuramoyl-tripeptide--D-alanyl-D-alanine ligase [Xanthomonadales bacterium]MBP7623044.1 UDP-N-acetylmuramoyl-tripeptide--D-alanyl-D-alanine ligase [Xanthomonadales bacterium]
MIRMSLAELASLIGARLHGGDRVFAGVVADSRKLESGQLFIALRGERVDGHDFVAEVAARGAAAAVVERVIDAALPQLVVANVEQALAAIARVWRARCRATVIAITGSNGKTTLKTLTHSILARAGRCHVNPGNLNNEIGLPLSLCALATDADFAVCEMGAGKPGDIAYLMGIAAPQIGIVNNVGAAHLERLGSTRGVAETKGAVYAGLPSDGIAVINADDDFASYFRGLAGKRAIVTFALDRAADVRGQILASDTASQRLVIDTRAGSISLTLSLTGRHNALNALAATALALAAGATLDQVRLGLETAHAVSGRLVRKPLVMGATLIDDSYNANPASMRAAIDTLQLQPSPRWLVVGDMKELGSEGPTLHHGIGAYARERGIERLYAVGELSRDACAGFGAAARHFDSQQHLIDALRAELGAGVTLLIKGSRSSAMDRVANAMLANGTPSGNDTGGSHAA